MADKSTQRLTVVGDCIYRGAETTALARVYGNSELAENFARAVNRDHLFGELVTALKVYANPDNWQEMTGEFLVYEPDDDDRIVFDAGQIARAVLAKVKDEGHG